MPSSILVVEDEPAIAELIAVNLQHAGHYPIRAYNAEQALSLMSDVLPDLVLLDWMLPGLRPEERWNAFRLVKLAMFPTEAEFLQFGDDEKQQRDSCMATVAIRCRDDMPPGCPFPTALVIPSPLAAAITRRGIQQPRGF